MHVLSHRDAARSFLFGFACRRLLPCRIHLRQNQLAAREQAYTSGSVTCHEVQGILIVLHLGIEASEVETIGQVVFVDLAKVLVPT